MDNVDDFPYYEGAKKYPRDPVVDKAKAVLLAELFGTQPQEVFFERQIQLLYEKQFFHWITAKALGELVAEDQIKTKLSPLINNTSIRFYWSTKNRYWTRKANEIKKLVQEYSHPEFLRAIGQHGEMMFDAALPTVGFLPRGRDVRAYQGREWTETGHNLDRVFERDNVAYGVEIKNTLPYIERREFEIKLAMCEYLQLKPLFIVRAAPKNYIQTVYQRGGFTLVFDWQLYPHGSGALADRIHKRLGLPVDCPRAIGDGTMQRFLAWHLNEIV